MTAKEAILTWNEGVRLAESQKLVEAIQKFSEIKDNPHASPSKMYFNIGTIQATLNDYETALENLRECLSRDSRLAACYFRRGIILHSRERYQEAHDEFMSCSEYIRNGVLDYTQLGLKCKIFECEALYNAGVCMTRAGSRDCALQAFTLAQRAQQATQDIRALTKKLDIDAALDKTKINLGGQLALVDPVKDRLFTPSQAKVKNAVTKDYLGKATVVSSVTDKDTFSGFVGPRKLESPCEPATKPTVTKSEPPAPPNGNATTATSPQPVIRRMAVPPANIANAAGAPPPMAADSSSNIVRPAVPKKTPPPRPVSDVASAKPAGEFSQICDQPSLSHVPASELSRQGCPQLPPPRRFVSQATPVAPGDCEPGTSLVGSQTVAQQQPQSAEASANSVLPVALRPKKVQTGSSNSDTSSSVKSRFINLELVIGEETEALCVKMETLDLLYRKISEKLSCPSESFSLWCANKSGVKERIETDEALQHVWAASSPTGKAQLWCYARW